MKYSFMSFSCPELNLRAALKLALESGYTGFEPRIGCNHRHGIELDMSPTAIMVARAIAQDSGITLCCLATSVQLASRARLRDNIEIARRAIEICAELGIPTLRLFGGPIDEGMTRTAAIEQIAAALDMLSGEIGTADVRLCLETHDDWCEPAHVAAVMRLCKGSHVGVNWDVMHPVLTAHASIQDAFGLLRPYIGHVHIHGGTRVNNKLEFRPISQSVIDHRQALRALVDCGYDGFLSGEWIDWTEPDYLRRELATMLKYEEDLACTH